eukprot:354691-Chlamydomonas_euryale.AAC.8
MLSASLVLCRAACPECRRCGGYLLGKRKGTWRLASQERRSDSTRRESPAAGDAHKFAYVGVLKNAEEK